MKPAVAGDFYVVRHTFPHSKVAIHIQVANSKNEDKAIEEAESSIPTERREFLEYAQQVGHATIQKVNASIAMSNLLSLPLMPPNPSINTGASDKAAQAGYVKR